ncbi:MAG: DUF805 domain-containing protein, partial [Eubacterium sp.]|nr:DUF805 domain-containing protein [Eubacterium sp.]MDY4110819.1 DUF805 domain-containing protein [Eubacterium sp.]
TMKLCKTCGAKLNDDAAFCYICGGAAVQADTIKAPTDFDDTEATTVLNESEFDDKAEETTVLSGNSPYQNGNSYQNNNLYQGGNNQSEYSNIIEKPSFKDCYIKFWKNYTNFSGRARRSEYWYVVLANILISLVTMIPYVGPVIDGLYMIAILVPTLALMVRRLHDLGKDWYYIFFALIPLVGQIIMLVWFCTDSQVGANEFGENPKGVN